MAITSIENQQALGKDRKGATSHVEDPDFDMALPNKDVADKVDDAQPPADFRPVQQLGLVQALKTYRMATIVCTLAAVGALSDGYQVQMSGSIVALPGFIRTFGDKQDDGAYKINPQYLALWGCKSDKEDQALGGFSDFWAP